MTIAQAIDYFLIDQQLKGNSDKTIQGYKGFLRRFAVWLEANSVTVMDELTLQRINQYQLHIDRKQPERSGGTKLAKRSVQTYMRHIKCFVSYCYAEGFITDPIHQRMKTPKAERPVIEILTGAELNEIFACFTKSETGRRNTALIMLMVDCGLRLREVTTIKINDINLEKGYLSVMGKGRKGRIVPLGLKVRRAIMAYIYKRRQADSPEDNQYLFLTQERKPIQTACVASLMTRLKRQTGIARLHAHLFRHTFATNFLVHGIGDVYELSRLLGHSELRITEGYLQLASYYTIIEKRRRLSYLDLQQ